MHASATLLYVPFHLVFIAITSSTPEASLPAPHLRLHKLATFPLPTLFLVPTHSLIHHPQLPLPTTFPEYAFRIDPTLRPAIIAQPPLLNFLPAGTGDLIMRRHSLWGCAGVLVDSRIEGTAEGFANAL